MEEVVYCRNTARGAKTFVTVLGDPAEVWKFDRSRTGNHWAEGVQWEDGAVVWPCGAPWRHDAEEREEGKSEQAIVHIRCPRCGYAWEERMPLGDLICPRCKAKWNPMDELQAKWSLMDGPE